MRVSYLADNPREAKKIARWYFDEWGHYIPGRTEKEVFEKVCVNAESRTTPPLMITIHEQGGLVAVAELKFHENENHPEYEHWLSGIFVSRRHRNKGYASVLISEAKKHAAKLKLQQLYLQCEPHIAGLYLKHDFRILHKTVHRNIETIIMGWQTNRTSG